MSNPNFDLFVRRKRLRVTQRDVGKLLGISRLADISDFENGHRDLPRGLTRADYERALDQIESQQGAAA